MANESPAKTVSSADIASPALQAARRLRRVQISFADEPDAKRRAYLSEELETILKTIQIDCRAAFLVELEAAFPVLTLAATAPCVQADESPRAQDTVEGLVSALAERASSLSEAEREALLDRLSDAGLCRVDRTPPSTDTNKTLCDTGGEDAKVRESLKYIAKSLKIERVDMARLAKTTVMLAVYMGQLDQVVWNAWQAVAPRSGLRRKTSLEKALQSYISGDASISGTDLNAHIATTKKLLTAFIAAIGQLGVQLTRHHLAPFAPQEIQLAVRKGANPLISHDAACWAYYQRLARGLEEESVDDAVREILAKNIADMTKN